MIKKIVNVAVGVVLNGDEVLICKRAEDQHQGGLWEFPGGKIEADETVFAALKRELKEEVDIEIASGDLLMTIDHDYGDKCVSLHVLLVEQFTGKAKGLEHQPLQWVNKHLLKNYKFPAANIAIIEALLAR
ncbi:Mutator mutT protein (7,8-dihydro-8-oxoguanine-triphosphatase) [Pseudoalteromonas luteoviolacea B = ATCC 29581]|nr:Mutator mutT protein (7,8-dihydro-8-oxoguanine-triphosphatase) [Pseudoalteromonas luteoviolacea B = ATCC 29581]